MSKRLRLGELLVEAGVIDEDQRERALEAHRETGRRFGAMLVEMRFLDEETLVRTLARQLSLPVVWLDGRRIRQEVLDRVPQGLVFKYGCLPVQMDPEGEGLLLAMEDPLDQDAIEEVAAKSGLPVRPVLAAPTELSDAIRRHAPDPGDSLAAAEFVNARDPAPELVSLHGAGGLPPLPKPPAEPKPAQSNDLVLRALTQLLVEKGLLTRSELIERLGALSADGKPGEA